LRGGDADGKDHAEAPLRVPSTVRPMERDCGAG
jgi:hypothetical protein